MADNLLVFQSKIKILVDEVLEKCKENYNSRNLRNLVTELRTLENRLKILEDHPVLKQHIQQRKVENKDDLKGLLNEFKPGKYDKMLLFDLNSKFYDDFLGLRKTDTLDSVLKILKTDESIEYWNVDEYYEKLLNEKSNFEGVIMKIENKVSIFPVFRKDFDFYNVLLIYMKLMLFLKKIIMVGSIH